ncbi:MAG: DNA2/NAM7 family helicase [Planctomycetes bacterium]|nr:DNA2/NAM7 family helicase [Planctomycetota bacterium]
MGDAGLEAGRWDLIATGRLPSDAAALVAPFYDFPFEAFAEPGERQIIVEGRGSKIEGRTLDLLREGTVVGLTIPTPDTGPPLERDDEMAATAASVIRQLLRRGARVRVDGRARKLDPKDIGISSTHRAMNSALDLALPKSLRRKVVVDTPERWQGLERPVMIVVHPLSGTLRPSAFDLETGRLCVMASRHTAGLIVLARDHLAEKLNGDIPVAGQSFGRKDVEGRGLRDNLAFWNRLRDGGRIVNLK